MTPSRLSNLRDLWTHLSDIERELLEEVELMKAELAKRAPTIPGRWHCSKCNFELSRTSISAHTGDFGTSWEDRQVPEMCPNSCGVQLEQVTWEQGYRDMSSVANQKFEELEQAKERLRQLQKQLDDAKDDLCRLDGACWYCLSPEVEDAWRHEHAPQGPHWHHCLDPGDGLVSDCEHSEMYERVFQEGMAEGRKDLESANARLREALTEAQERNRRSICVYCGEAQTLSDPAKLRDIMAEHIVNCSRHPLNRVVGLLTAIELLIERTEACPHCFDLGAALAKQVAALTVPPAPLRRTEEERERDKAEMLKVSLEGLGLSVPPAKEP